MLKRYLNLIVVVIITLRPGPASATSNDGGETGGVLSLDNDYVILDPTPSPFIPMEQSPWQVVFLNFDGEKLVQGGNDAKTNKTQLVLTSTLDYPPLNWSNLGGKEAGKKAVVDELKKLFLKFAVKFVTERPTDGDYTMAMIGGTGENCAKGGPGTVGIAPLDCKNINRNDICLIFGDLMNTSARQLALVIAHELGHTFGLEHVSDKKGIMYPAANPEVCCFVSSDLSEPSQCGRTTQDAGKVLEENVGVGKQDTQPPAVWIVRPGDGAILPPDFTFEVTAADDLGVHHVIVYLDGKKVLELDEPPYSAALTGVADGEHLIKAEVYDWIELNNSAEVTITVDAACAREGTCSSGKGGINDRCQLGSQCTSGICATQESGEGRCIDLCDGAAETKVCPGELTCLQSGDAWACLPDQGKWILHSGEAGDDGGGGCRLAPSSPPVLGLYLILVGLLIVVARNRFTA